MAYGSRLNKTLFLQHMKNGVFYFSIPSRFTGKMNRAGRIWQGKGFRDAGREWPPDRPPTSHPPVIDWALSSLFF